jgi:hypothetical protein
VIPWVILHRHSESKQGDPSNFSLNGKLGKLLRSSSFAQFMHPYFDSDDDSGRSTEQIWHWLTWNLNLRPWKDQTSTDLEWLDERLLALDFLTRRKIDAEVRWVWEGAPFGP